ncbi:hypothetical protein TrST_g8310 [Triparma strigata]|uniref:PA domain-containing protein n=1 Tax=Triparma strigata TaxID=1606541 RepID=A0A9W7BWY1_9STRA|nr:hypothetical protein TrST_g8310 [Triparma strigata]
MLLMKILQLLTIAALLPVYHATVIDLVDDVRNLDALPGISSSFNVIFPPAFRRPDGYEHREALFGVPPYGGELAQNVYYADSDLCGDDPVDKTGNYPCPALDPVTGKCKDWQSPFILMVDRGECTFVHKVRRAQQAGASAVIIADNSCMCDKQDQSEGHGGTCQHNSGQCTCTSEVPCESFFPIMADDGSGGDITIPSLLLYKQDADVIISQLKSNTIVQVQLTWNLPAPDDRVEWDLWSNPTEPISSNFQKSFRPAVESLGSSQFFTPHFYIYDGVSNNCHTGNNCGTLCTNHGRYCAIDPDNNLSEGISGADVVAESLRRLCIWDTHGGDGVGSKYWMYLEEFLKDCYDPSFPNEPRSFPKINDWTCSNNVMKKVGIDSNTIESCINFSGGITDDVINSKLKGEIDKKIEQGVIIVPTTYVNTVAMRGSISTSSVFNTICAGFLDGTAPEICGSCYNCFDVAGCVHEGYCGGSLPPSPSPSGGKKGSVSGATLVLSLLITVGVMGGGGYVYYRRTQREMRDQVRGILAEYMPLDDGQEGGTQMVSKAGGNMANI